MTLRSAIIGLVLALPAATPAMTLEFPAAAVPVADKATVNDSYFVPTGAFYLGAMTGITAEGSVRQQSWRVGAGGLTTMQLLAPLRDQLLKAGFTELYECADQACGGFDFRFNIEVLPEPDMHVNLGDFRYFAALRDDGAEEYVAILVSRSANAGFVQMTTIGEPEITRGLTASTKAPPAEVRLAETGPVGVQLETLGYATLDDLDFDIGSASLRRDAYASLNGLAEYLADNPDRRVTLVGHTDAEGALDANIALSRKRASSVMVYLVDKLGVARHQVSADGVGYLAPRSSNLSDDGRTQNRRVEVILTSTQ